MITSEVPVSGSKYPRAKRVIIDNPLGGVPSATFINEQVFLLGDDTVRRDLSATSTAGLPMDTSVTVLDPETDQPIATQSYSDILANVYTLLYSIHRHLGV